MKNVIRLTIIISLLIVGYPSYAGDRKIITVFEGNKIKISKGKNKHLLVYYKKGKIVNLTTAFGSNYILIFSENYIDEYIKKFEDFIRLSKDRNKKSKKIGKEINGDIDIRYFFLKRESNESVNLLIQIDKDNRTIDELVYSQGDVNCFYNYLLKLKEVIAKGDKS